MFVVPRIEPPVATLYQFGEPKLGVALIVTDPSPQRSPVFTLLITGVSFLYVRTAEDHVHDPLFLYIPTWRFPVEGAI